MPWTREQMAERAAKELRDGFYANLGIGIPTLVANYIPAGIKVQFHSENGMLGIGPYPTETEIDADREITTHRVTPDPIDISSPRSSWRAKRSHPVRLYDYQFWIATAPTRLA